MTLNLSVSGGTYQQYFRATSNADFFTNTGTFTMVQLAPKFGTYGCSGALTQWDVVGGVATQLSAATVPCYSGMVIRSVIYGSTISTLIEGQIYTSATSNTGGGQPGVGLGLNPYGNGVSQVQLGLRSLAVPAAINSQTIAYQALDLAVNLHWIDPADVTGVGIAQHTVWRGQWGGTPTYYATVPGGGTYSDPAVMQATAYGYGLGDISFHGVAGPITEFKVDTNYTPGVGGTNPRRVGVRPTGVYYGAQGENIDMLSGNLNFTIPLIQAKSRGSSVTFSLSYNSQMWLQDRTGTWLQSEDIGYGIGFKLQAGALTPFWSGGTWASIDHYQFIDSTGAEYALYPATDGSGTYVSKESIYVTFDPNINLLHSNDGSLWFMGCVSGGTESDNGTMYPTEFEDTNGNFIKVNYEPGAGTGWGNSSARIATIYDVRSTQFNNNPTYTFSYGLTSPSDPIPHLDSIRNSVGTSENFNFFTASGQSFVPPYSGAAALPNTTNLVYLVGGVSANSNFQGPNYTYHFFYDSAEELTQVVFPAGGDMRWDYVNFLYGEDRDLREVSNRYVSQASSGGGYGPEVVYPITHGVDSQGLQGSLGDFATHQTTQIYDPNNGEKAWTFISNYMTGFNGDWTTVGLVNQYDQRSGANGVSLKQDNFTWATDANGNHYISQDQTVMNAGQSYAQTATTQQTIDVYGNVTQKKVFDYTNANTPIRIYNYTYLNTPSYLARYIRNRLVSAQVTDGYGQNPAVLTANQYDTVSCSSPMPDTSTATQHDAAYAAANGVRGNLTYQTTPAGNTCNLYDPLGNVFYTKAPHAPAMAIGTAGGMSGTNYSMPSSIIANSTASFTVGLSYSAAFAPSGFTGPNGAAASVTYDAFGRAATSTSVDGAVTTYTYSAQNTLPMTQLAYTQGVWTLTTLDGFGRAASVQTGPGSGPNNNTVSETDTVYAPCACSPIGKMTKVSQPYAPGSTVYWTTYTYDGLGRTVSVLAPDGASATTYQYQGNTTTVTDAAGKWKTTTSDVQGNTVQVAEPDPSGNSSALYAGYTYDDMEHLTQVSMPRGGVTQTRTFIYSPTTHLLTGETHPETGTTGYTYYTTYGTGYSDLSTADLIQWKTDAKGQATKYLYDSFDRVVEIHRYPHGQSQAEDVCQRVVYAYDGYGDSSYTSLYAVGRLAAAVMGDPSCPVTPGGITQQFTEAFSYSSNGSGRVTQKHLELYNATTGNPSGGSATWWDVGYRYNVLGQTVSVIYPNSGGYGSQFYTTGFDAMQRPATLTDRRGFQVVSGVIYNAANQPVQTQFELAGASTYFYENRGYNAMNQLTSLNNFNLSPSVVSNGALNLTYNYPSGQDNGQIASMTDNVLGQTVSYAYDALKRLTSASGSGGSAPWSQAYSYDGFGNLTGKSGSGAVFSNAVDPATNRLVGTNICYDPDGNLVSDQNGGGCGNPNYTYDVANRLVSAKVSGGTETYAYDAGNKRISKIDANGTQTILSLRRDGEKLVVANAPPGGTAGGSGSSTLPSSNQVYFAGRLIKQNTDYLNQYDSNFVAVDRLGSVRATYSGSTTSYLPYGEELSATANDLVKFATYTRDASTGLDYAEQRFYTSQFGRFMSADRFKRAASINSTGTWNKYSYALGDPVNWRDPHGTNLCPPDTDDSVNVCDQDPGDGDGGITYCEANPSDPSCGGGGSGGAGSGGGGDDTPTSQNRALLLAIKEALDSALSNTDCASIFGRSPSQMFGTAPNAENVLDSLIGSTGGATSPYGSIQFTDPGNGSVAGGILGDSAAVTIANHPFWHSFGLPSSSTVYISTLVAGNNFDTSVLNAETTVLHELGHVLSNLNWTGNQILGDVNNPNQSAANDALIQSKCIK